MKKLSFSVNLLVWMLLLDHHQIAAFQAATPFSATNARSLAPLPSGVERPCLRLPITRLQMATVRSPKESKRRRFVSSVKKVISYPKRFAKQVGSKMVDYLATKKISAFTILKGENAVDEATTIPSVVLEAIAKGPSKETEQVKESTIMQSEQAATSISFVPSPASAFIDETTVEIPQASVGTIALAEPLTRSATAQVDLSGKWELMVTDKFKSEYDRYLLRLQQPQLVRTVALSIISMTTEAITQSNDGKELTIRGRNMRGDWERTLVASLEDDPLFVPIITADKETVEAEAWWENGRVHRSFLRGGKKYDGDFESKRYLEDDGNTLVCETEFYPRDSRRERASLTWRFRRANEGSP